jgi:D-alanine-D-alanine ligase
MPLRVGLAYNLRKNTIPSGLPDDYYAEFDEESTVNAIADALKRAGCSVLLIEADENAYGTLLNTRPDIVFNIAEGLRGESRESHIPAILEMLGIPYTGSGPLTLAIALDKMLTQEILHYKGAPTPRHQVLTAPEDRLNMRLRFPLIVKPIHEGSSKGIRNDSVVSNEERLKEKVAYIVKNYDQPALVEEFIDGREFTVGLLGNKNPVVLPIVEITFKGLPKGANKIYSYEAKWIWDIPEKPLDMFQCPAHVPPELSEKIGRVALRVFKILGCRDMCRVDMRVDESGTPYILEVNPLPGMIPDPKAHSCLPEAARAAGFTYDQLICTILYNALERYGMGHRLEDMSLVKLPEKVFSNKSGWKRHISDSLRTEDQG